MALAAPDAREDFAQSVLYAITELAVDTEKNAARIEELGDRLSDLEEKLKQGAAAAK